MARLKGLLVLVPAIAGMPRRKVGIAPMLGFGIAMFAVGMGMLWLFTATGKYYAVNGVESYTVRAMFFSAISPPILYLGLIVHALQVAAREIKEDNLAERLSAASGEERKALIGKILDQVDAKW